MGNYASCTLGGLEARATKVVFPGGQIHNFIDPVKAAELMLEMPNFFVVNSKSVQIGRRFAALSADEDLQMGEVYAMFPMQRLCSVVAASDMATLFVAVSKKKKKASAAAMVRVVPEVITESTAPAPLRFDLRHRRSLCRSRNPVLDTIVEEPVTPR